MDFQQEYNENGIEGDFAATSRTGLEEPMEQPWGVVKSIRNDELLEEGVEIYVKDADKTLKVSTLLPASELAPIFAGSEWAGTRLWQAATLLTGVFYDKYVKTGKVNGGSLIELGCGLGVRSERASERIELVVKEQNEKRIDESCATPRRFDHCRFKSSSWRSSYYCYASSLRSSWGSNQHNNSLISRFIAGTGYGC